MIVITFILLASVALIVWAVALRQPLVLIAYSVLLLAMTVGTGGFFHSKGRLLLPAFPLLLPVAQGLSQKKFQVASWFTVALFAFVSASFGIYLRLVAHHSP